MKKEPVINKKTKKSLVIVESPAKARTIEQMLGSDYIVKASLGHIRDLPASGMGVDTSDSFTPAYVVPKDKQKILREIKKAGKECSTIFLATDPDREGEAISWHIAEAMGLDVNSVQRVVFHQITPEAVTEAFQSPRNLDLDLVNAQQARRILDRLVGYSLSPLLKRKLRWRGSLSAGRVQSVALKVVVEREQEIQAFTPTEYWSIAVTLNPNLTNDNSTYRESAQNIDATLHRLSTEKSRLSISTGEHASVISASLMRSTFLVSDITKQQRTRRPAAPFITSTLQQEGWRKARFGTERTMRIAQELYQGINIGSQGEIGLITYMRTDSPELAASAKKQAREYIKSEYGSDYLPKSARSYKTKVKAAQEAHEAIRPTDITRTPASVRSFLNRDQLRLYTLIWQRTVASQMTDSKSETTTTEITSSDLISQTSYILRNISTVTVFPGFTVLYIEGGDEESEVDPITSPSIELGDPLAHIHTEHIQHFTKPPGRYSEASLVKKMEEEGIGRPSTYAPIVSTLVNRDYIERADGRLTPSKLGETVSALLNEHFPDVMNVSFTARMEEELDEIARGERQWIPMLDKFYSPFATTVNEVLENAPRVDVATDQICEECERPMVIKTGRYGPFLSCSGYPECNATKRIVNTIGIPCPTCGGDIISRRSKKGRTFYGCSNYPECTFITGRRPLAPLCPSCQGLLVAARGDRAECTNCDFKSLISEIEEEPVAK